MEPDSRPRHRCERCGGDEDLYLLTLSSPFPSNGNAVICCAVCRTQYSPDVAVPMSLVTPRLLLGLQRLRKLNANLGHLLQTIEFG